jgi:uncharacterized iron-regulated membrane protein
LPVDSPPPVPTKDAAVRRLIFNIHLLLALTAGAFLTLLGITGSIIAFEQEWDGLLHPHLSYVSPRKRALSLGEISDAVSRRYIGEPIVAFLLPSSPGLSAQVVLPSGIVYVNQYTGEILGVRTRGQTLLGFTRALHVRLGAGDVGRDILKWSTVAMLFSLASGLCLWWPLKRVRTRGGWRQRRFWFDLHNALGIFALFPLLVLALTGGIIGFEDLAARLINKLAGSTTSNTSQTSTQQEPSADGTPITPDEAVAIALAEMPGAIPYRVQMPRFGGLYRVSLRSPQDKIMGDRNSVAVDPHNGKVIFSVKSGDSSVAQRILATNEAIHTGNIFGMPSKIIVSLTSVALSLQVFSGLVMWLRRKKLLPTPEVCHHGASDI